MKILERARDIILNPRITWQTIKEEAVEVKLLFVNYAAPLALIPVVCSLIGMTIIGIRMPAGSMIRAPFLSALFGGLTGYILHLAGVLLGGWVVKILAPFFGSKNDLNSAVKVVVYSMTPVWLAGVFSLIPGLGILSLLGLYGIYLLVLGLPVIMETPSEKVALYTISILAVGLLISLILSGIIVGTIYGPMYMRMMAM